MLYLISVHRAKSQAA